MSLGDNIKRLRQEHDLTLEELGKRIDLPRQSIYSFEKGVKLPSIEKLCQIADALNCSTDELLGRNVLRKELKHG